MTDFTFTSPEGKSYTVSGPDGATKEQAFAILQQQLAHAPATPAADPKMAGVPGYDSQGKPLQNAGASSKPDNSKQDNLLGKVFGLIEPALVMGSGAIGSTVGAIVGVGKSITGGKYGTQEGVREGEQVAGKVADALTYTPRTQTGAKLSQMAGNALDQSGIVGIPLPELNALGHAASEGAAAARPLAAATNAPINAADAAIAASKGGKLSDLVKAPQQMAGVGAADSAVAAQRAARAQSMPVPVKLTTGQLTRNFDQVQFERETAKAKEGKPLIDRYDEQNSQMGQNLDAFADQTGSDTANNLRATGKSVVSAVADKKAAAKSEVNQLYQQARDAGEMNGKVDVTPLVKYIEENKGKDKLAPIISTIEGELKQNATVEGGKLDNLTLTPTPAKTMMTLDASEDLRQAINKLAQPGTPNIVYGKEMKGLIDAAQEGQGGDLFKQARRAYENYANQFENRDVIDKLLRDKPGTKDRAVAYEDVMKHTLLNGSLDDVRHVFRTLEAHPANADPAIAAAGQQAAKDLRGALVNHIKDEMFKNVSVDSHGVRVGSPKKIDSLVSELDKDGKLDAIFGKQGAQQLRDVRDLALDVYTSPPGAVNHSNTASALERIGDKVSGAMDAIPYIGPALKYGVNEIKASQTRRKVGAALNPNLSELSGRGQ